MEKEHEDCIVFSRDCNVHLLLDHKINQKTNLTPSSPETLRMIIRQQQQERILRILSKRTNIRATKQQALTISYNTQRNGTRPNLRPSDNNIFKCLSLVAWLGICQNSFEPYELKIKEARGKLVIVVYLLQTKPFYNYLCLGIYPSFFNLNTLYMFCIFCIPCT